MAEFAQTEKTRREFSSNYTRLSSLQKRRVLLLTFQNILMRNVRALRELVVMFPKLGKREDSPTKRGDLIMPGDYAYENFP